MAKISSLPSPWTNGLDTNSAKSGLNPKLPISPCLIRLRASQSTDLGQVIYANSITLTPGTITLDVRDDIILVHNLTDEMADDLLTNEMDRRVTQLEGDA